MREEWIGLYALVDEFTSEDKMFPLSNEHQIALKHFYLAWWSNAIEDTQEYDHPSNEQTQC